MNVLFCGSYLPQLFESKLENLSAAANQFQCNLINELKKYHNVKVISYIGIPLECGYDVIVEECKNENVTCVFKSKHIIDSVRIMKKKIKTLLTTSDVIITYNVAYGWLGSEKVAKKMNKKSILILADYTPVEEENGLKKIYAKLMLRSIRRYDRVIILSEKAKSLLRDNQEVHVMEGGIRLENFDNFMPSKYNITMKIMYSGLLSNVTGVDILIETIKKCRNNNIEFIITGRGSLSDEIKQLANVDERVKYYAFVEKEKYLDLLKSSNVLINPRNMNFKQNANNFPSKILEYLATGKIIISTKFPGYSKFEGYMLFCESNSESLLEEIHNCYVSINDEMIINIYKRNREFAQEFSWREQVNKIIT